jgi:orotate phosphoribosyltransferase
MAGRIDERDMCLFRELYSVLACFADDPQNSISRIGGGRISVPDDQANHLDHFLRAILEKYPDADVLAGVATAGIAWGAMAADQLKLPYIYVRPKPKEHGLGNQIEGALENGQKVLVIEDLISTGKSSLQVCNVLKAAGANVIGMVSIFTYGFEIADNAFKEAGIPYQSLTNYQTLISLALEKGIVAAAEQETLLNWRANPANWTGI